MASYGNTAIYSDNGMTNVILHNTRIVAFDTKKIVLDSNCYRTATTKRRMNQISQDFGLGFSVFSKHSQWFVDFGGEIIAYFDGIELNRKTQ